MKKKLFKNLLLIFIAAAIHSNASCQSNSNDYQEQQENYSDAGDINDGTNDNEQSNRYGHVEYNDATDIAYYKPSAASSSDWPNSLSGAAVKGSNQETQKPRTLGTTADCPECLPDPGGDVTDVPLDRRLLVFLFASAGFIVIKADNKNKKDEGEDPDKK